MGNANANCGPLAPAFRHCPRRGALTSSAKTRVVPGRNGLRRPGGGSTRGVGVLASGQGEGRVVIPHALTPGPSPADGRGELNGFAFSLRHALAPGPDSLSMGAPPKGRQECLPSASGRGEFRVPATGRTGDCQNRLLTNSNVGVGPQAPGGKFPLRALTPLRGGA